MPTKLLMIYFFALMRLGLGLLNENIADRFDNHPQNPNLFLQFG